MSNNGFRVVIDRRGSQYFWSLTVNGEQYEGPRGSPTMGLAAEDADVFRKQLTLAVTSNRNGKNAKHHRVQTELGPVGLLRLAIAVRRVCRPRMF